jgi:hypothetical protein
VASDDAAVARFELDAALVLKLREDDGAPSEWCQDCLKEDQKLPARFSCWYSGCDLRSLCADHCALHKRWGHPVGALDTVSGQFTQCAKPEHAGPEGALAWVCRSCDNSLQCHACMKTHVDAGHRVESVDSLRPVCSRTVNRAVPVLTDSLRYHLDLVGRLCTLQDTLQRNWLAAQDELARLSEAWHASVSERVAAMHRDLDAKRASKDSKLQTELTCARVAVAELQAVLSTAEAPASVDALRLFYVADTVAESMDLATKSKVDDDVRLDLGTRVAPETTFRKYWEVKRAVAEQWPPGSGLAAARRGEEVIVVASDDEKHELSIMRWDQGAAQKVLLVKVFGQVALEKAPLRFQFNASGNVGFVSHADETVLCVSDAGSHSLLALDLSTMAVRGQVGIHNPGPVATWRHLVAVVSGWGSGTTRIILCRYGQSASHMALMRIGDFAYPAIRWCDKPRGLCFSRDGSELLVADTKNRRLCVLGVSDMCFLRVLVSGLPGFPTSIALHHGCLVCMCTNTGMHNSALLKVTEEGGKVSATPIVEFPGPGLSTALAAVCGVGLFIHASSSLHVLS